MDAPVVWGTGGMADDGPVPESGSMKSGRGALKEEKNISLGLGKNPQCILLFEVTEKHDLKEGI